MATVTRIAAVSYLDTIPFLYGVAHADELRAELFLSDFPAVIDRFRRGEADFALVPAHVVPSLAGARPVTDYCIAAPSALMIRVLAECEPEAPVLDYFYGDEAPLAPLLASDVPFVYALWVAREGVDAATEEAFRRALTDGVERIYEAVVAYGYADRPYDAYGYLTRLDCIFDIEKRRALEKFWDAGLKTAPRANPG